MITTRAEKDPRDHLVRTRRKALALWCCAARRIKQARKRGKQRERKCCGWGFVVRSVPRNRFALLGVLKPHCRAAPRRKRTEGGDRTRAAAKPSPTPIEVVLARTHRPATKRRQGVDEVNCSASLAWPLLSLRGEN